MSRKAYKVQKIGGSYYLCIPSPFFSQGMLDNGVVIELVEKNGAHTVIELREANGEHDKDFEADRENTSEPRLTNNIREADRLE